MRHRLLNTLIGKQVTIGAKAVAHTDHLSFNIAKLVIPPQGSSTVEAGYSKPRVRPGGRLVVVSGIRL